ncbi:MAG: transporter associated domain-containing protein [Betaproteobacteria bacterium]
MNKAIKNRRSLSQRLRHSVEKLLPTVKTREHLLDLIGVAEQKNLIGTESRIMLEGVLKISGMHVAEIMIPAPKMDMLDISMNIDEMMDKIIDIGHSRYPVYEEDKENIIGVLMTKDVLKWQRAPEINLRVLLRTAIFVPETKNLTDLLRDFKKNRNHMAMVVDEFGRISGLVTFEDLLEEIVGEIEDEFDTDTDDGEIYSLVDKSFRVAGHTDVSKINESFNVQLNSDEQQEQFETIGGLIAHLMGHVPGKGEHYDIQGLRFEVMHSKSGVVKWYRVKRIGN